MIGVVGCVRCGRRQVDPDSGPSLWRRAVLGGSQVLVCPDCQGEGWTEDLDSCSSCASTMLVKRLGEVACRACGATEPGPPAARPVPVGPAEALAADVAAALDRILGRDPA